MNDGRPLLSDVSSKGIEWNHTLLHKGLWLTISNLCLKTSDSAGLLRGPFCPTFPVGGELQFQG